MADQQDPAAEQDQPEVTVQQSGGLSLGAMNEVEVQGDLVAGDKVDGDKVLGDKIVNNYYQTSTAPAPPDQYRLPMLKKVRLIWVEGLLVYSIDRKEKIVLQLEERPDAVMLRLNEQVQELNRPPRSFPFATPIIDIFDRAVGTLLILGAAGAGKSTLLLELASDLIDRAIKDDHHPIPVVFNLSSWATKRQPLAAWLVEELQSKYTVPPRIGRAWIASDKLLPLLDGLDEVAWEHRAACVNAINAYRADHGLAPLAVCSRFDDYTDIAVKLCLNSAMMVKPLTKDQIDAYLAAAGSRLAGLRAALSENTALRDLATSPLMLSIMIRAYQDAPVETQSGTSLAEERRLFDVYVERMLTRHAAERYYPRERTLRWLGWLARAMLLQKQQSIFQLEQLDPSLLASWRWRFLYHALVRLTGGLMFIAACVLAGVAAGSVSPISTPQEGMAIGLMIGVVFGLALVIASVLALWMPKTYAALLVVVVTAILALAVAPSLSDAVLTALILGLPGSLAGLSLFGSGPIQPVGAMSLAWPRIRLGLGLGLSASLVLAVVFTLIGNATAGLTLGLLVGVCCLLPAVIFGMLKREAIEPSVVPNQGIHRSLRIATIVFVALALAGSLTGIVYGIFDRHDIGKGLAFGLILGVPMALVAAFAAGGAVCIQHYLLRAVLATSGATPWRYQRFLGYVTERVFLRRIGGGYIFYHRLLMEYLAEYKEATHGQR